MPPIAGYLIVGHDRFGDQPSKQRASDESKAPGPHSVIRWCPDKVARMHDHLAAFGSSEHRVLVAEVAAGPQVEGTRVPRGLLEEFDEPRPT